MKGRRGIALVVHDAGKHVVDIRQFLIDEKYPLAARYGRNQPRQLILVKDVGHSDSPFRE